MKYKVQKLSVDTNGIVDIPEGWIPIKYEEILTLVPGRGTFGENVIRTDIIVLEPLKKDE